jgi:hypothetical protein
MEALFPGGNEVFSKFLKKHRIGVAFEEYITTENFKLPTWKEKQFYIFKTKGATKTMFILNNNRLFCLGGSSFIHLDKGKYCNGDNFMYGQSELRVTKDRRIVIDRQGKIDRLRGNIEDGTWTIEAYAACHYRAL